MSGTQRTLSNSVFLFSLPLTFEGCWQPTHPLPDTIPFSAPRNLSMCFQACSTDYPKFCMPCKETVQAIGDWIFQGMLCQWGALSEIISDNGKPFTVALMYLEKKYHVKHICISGYNLHVNSIMEWSGHTSMCGKHCTWQWTVNKTSGPKSPIQCFGPSES